MEANPIVEQLERLKVVGPTYAPSLWDFNRFVDAQGFVGDEKDRTMVFLSFIVAGRSTGVESLSSGGKTAMCEAVLRVFPDEFVYHMDLGSQKAEMYSGDAIKRAKVAFLPELQIAMRKDSELVVELLKKWGEGKDLDYNRVVGTKTRRFHLPYRPFLYTLALENKIKPDEELSRRVVKLTTDISSDQTKRVMEAKAWDRVRPDSQVVMEPWEMIALKRYVVGVKEINGGLRFVNPYAMWLQSKIPNTFVTARTMVQQYLDCIEAVTRFYLPQGHRLRIEDRLSPKAFVSLADCWALHTTYGENFLYASLQIPQHGHAILGCFKEEIALAGKQSTLGGKVYLYLTLTDIQKKLREKGVVVKKGVVADFVNRLVASGYLEAKEDSRTPFYTISTEAAQFETNLAWAEGYKEGVGMIKTHWPDHADAFLDAEEAALAATIHPLTGQKVDILSTTITAPLRAKLDEITSGGVKPSGAIPATLETFGGN